MITPTKHQNLNASVLRLAAEVLNALREAKAVRIAEAEGICEAAAGMDGKRQTGYTDTGVDLVAAKPAAGVKSIDTKTARGQCWGD